MRNVFEYRRPDTNSKNNNEKVSYPVSYLISAKSAYKRHHRNFRYGADESENMILENSKFFRFSPS